MQLSAGSRLGPYEIVSRIGAGGMGEVWRARDTRLDRSVAIKVLPAELAKNAQLRVRFEREAKTISQLNHPHICTLYDVGDNYLVMELLEGESLAERLAKGPLPLADVLRYGSQIADALDRAHRHNVVHRDVKPGNVMLSRSSAKLLDFGLAKAGALDVNPDAPTQQAAPITEQGTILGTFQYMAPEQLEGLEADARTDIFALGAVLYEMATGRRAFEGKTRTSLIAAIVGSEPKPLAEVLPLTPPALEHVVTKCLRKDPNDRWQSAHDVAEELRWIGEQLSKPEAIARRRSSKLPWAIAALLAALAAAFFALRPRAAATVPASFIVLPEEGSFSSYAALSPDGKTIAYTASVASQRAKLYLRRLDDIEAKAVAGIEGTNRPSWSPDGRYIADFSRQQLRVIDTAGGGAPRAICSSGYGVGSAWSDDASTIVFSPSFGSGLFRVATSGGKAEALTKLDAKRGETAHIWPVHIPNSQNYLFVNVTAQRESPHICVVSLAGGTPKHLTEATSLIGYSAPYLVFERGGVMYAQELDEKKMELRGAPIAIVNGVRRSGEWITSGGGVAGDVLMYQHQPPRRVAFRTLTPGAAPFLETDEARQLVLSRDERQLLFIKIDPATGFRDAWTYDFRRSLATRLTSGGNVSTAAWSPDGKEIAFSSDTDGLFDVFVVPSDGSASPTKILAGLSADKNVVDWSPDGTQLLVNIEIPDHGTDIWLLDLRTRHARPLYATEAVEAAMRFSPDGQWIAYQSSRSGRYEAYIRRIANGETIQISTNGGTSPEFSPDGSAVFYEEKTMLMKVALTPRGATLEPEAPQPQFSIARWRSADIKRDGTWIYIEDAAEAQPEQLRVITGWKARVAAAQH